MTAHELADGYTLADEENGSRAQEGAGTWQGHLNRIRVGRPPLPTNRCGRGAASDGGRMGGPRRMPQTNRLCLGNVAASRIVPCVRADVFRNWPGITKYELERAPDGPREAARPSSAMHPAASG